MTGKEIKGIKFGKEEIKLKIFINNIIIYPEIQYNSQINYYNGWESSAPLLDIRLKPPSL